MEKKESTSKKKAKTSKNKSIPQLRLTANDKKWEAEDAARTLVRAQEIRNNPKLFKRAMVSIESQKRALNSIKK